MSPEKRPTTQIRFPTDLYEQLKFAAAERDMGVGKLIVYACREFLERLVPPDEITYTYSRVPEKPIPLELTPAALDLGGFAQSMRDQGIHVGLQGYCVICAVAWPCAHADNQ